MIVFDRKYQPGTLTLYSVFFSFCQQLTRNHGTIIKGHKCEYQSDTHQLYMQLWRCHFVSSCTFENENFNLSMTLKIHVILDHYKYYFEETGTNFRHTNGEFTESCHSTLRKSEETHNLKIVKQMGTSIHHKKSLQSRGYLLDSQLPSGVDPSSTPGVSLGWTPVGPLSHHWGRPQRILEKISGVDPRGTIEVLLGSWPR